jgi:hypothetical protein
MARFPQSGSRRPKPALELRRCRRYGCNKARAFRGNPKRLNDKQDSEPLRRIYKICPAEAWREAERQGVYRGSADDISDGSRNDELFPHLYGELDLDAVAGVYNMPARADGTHDIPELAP